MTIKIKFLNPVTQDKFVHNLLNAKKKNSEYKHLYHKIIQEAKDTVSFRINNEEGKIIVSCEINFYPDENLVDIECHPCDFGKLQTLLVFDLLEAINEKAVVRFIDSKFYFDSGMDFYIVVDMKKGLVSKISSDRNRLLEANNAGITRRILAEIEAFDLI
ncbi:MAG: hypothetical protein UR66_C0010G0036 [Candidatus Moranbacteria bacterium GW2011_GWE1_35_17]|nr:MAG: hypothetical protein UR66_C0010G0036 [Candidatus Moranbacteria bacterium GW2011_GWE1_35_17]KKP83874.1 MAG: hypothetical protein UR82_C0017G0004 [Candidatus Moranbacteria bacterium GW2011_GWF1_35_5]KKP83935.1 MAG: hypothetical protein UR83_C0030G0019 [Candidatus Moranbacteria bacterium GW2011_GWF2_35_54]